MHAHTYIYSDWFDAQLKPLAQDMAGSAQSVATDGLAWPKSKHDPQLTEMTDTAGFQELSVWVADSCCSSWFNVPRVSLTKDLKLDKPLGRGYFGEVWQGPQIRSCCSWDMLGSSGDLLTKLCSSVTRSDLRRGYRAGRSSTPVWAATRSKWRSPSASQFGMGLLELDSTVPARCTNINNIKQCNSTNSNIQISSNIFNSAQTVSRWCPVGGELPPEVKKIPLSLIELPVSTGIGLWGRIAWNCSVGEHWWST